MSSLRAILAAFLLVTSYLLIEGKEGIQNWATSLDKRQKSIAGGIELRILPLGASIVYGMTSPDGNGFRYALWNQLVTKGNPVDMIGSVRSGTMLDNDVEGWPGYIIDQVAAKASLSTPSQPNLVLLNAGTNDCIQNVDITNAANRLGALINTLFSSIPGVTVIASTLLPNVNNENCVQTVNSMIPAMIAALQEQGKKVLYVDFHSIHFSTADIGTDGTHPTEAGYQKMAAVWYQGIQTASAAGWITAPATIA
ncbi:GDSL-like Lipase/Acylhydrolase [Marssonina coronariae]|uniref:GDSL-like Lipase/Acylhydrolase n=1 Tax=Diplocarpon coronariae TaxID=2795749 RepID=A0A218ZF55_9HELO|nr:GDSL-like Lipase/Acylhydrolase [Marssonina coronariae]